MRDSEFKRAYLNIIKEGLGDMTMGEEVPPQEATTEETATGSAKRICFTTSNEELINLLCREPGFEEVVFFVPEKDEQGNETISEVKLGRDAFEGIEISDTSEDEEDVANECGDAAESVENEDTGDTGGDIGDAGGIEEDVEEDVEEDEKELNKEGIGTLAGAGIGAALGGPVGALAGGALGSSLDEEDVEEDEKELNKEGIGTLAGAGIGALAAGPVGAVAGGALGSSLDEEAVDPSEWIEDGVCVKCGSAKCDGTCRCEKCGSVNCIGDCESKSIGKKGEPITEFLDPSVNVSGCNNGNTVASGNEASGNDLKIPVVPGA